MTEQDKTTIFDSLIKPFLCPAEDFSAAQLFGAEMQALINAGLRKALARPLTGVSWQRCQFHFQQNAQAYVTKTAYKATAAAHIRNQKKSSAKMILVLPTQPKACILCPFPCGTTPHGRVAQW